MATTNPVYQVLAPTGNQALLAAGNRPAALAIGQVGIFNYHTGLSIDGTDLASAQDIVIMVGVDPEGKGSTQDIVQSAGQMIQVRHSKAYTFRGYIDMLPKIIDIADFTAQCQKEYGIRIELRNGEIYHTYQYNQFSKYFSSVAGCCPDPCVDCASADANPVVIDLVTQINADPDQLVLASYIANFITATITAGAGATASATITVGTTAYTVPLTTGQTATQVAAAIASVINTATGSPYAASNSGAVLSIYPRKALNTPTGTFAITNANGTGITAGSIAASTKVTVADPTTFLATNPGAGLAIRLTSQPVGKFFTGDINLHYVKNRATDMNVALVEGFTCNGSQTTVQNVRNSEGDGYDLRQMEYEAGGWNGKPGPYRQSELMGQSRQGFQYYISNTGTYNQLILEYDLKSVGGWEEYYNNLKTIIAVPCADAITIAAIVAVLDLIFANRFGAMAGDVTANGDCTNAATSTLTPATDGIESLA